MFKRFSLLFMLFTLLHVSAAASFAAVSTTTGPWGVSVAGFKNLSSAVASPQTAGKNIVVDKAVSCNTLTIPADRSVTVVKPGMITVNAGHTLSIKGSFTAGLYKVFAGAGTVDLGVGSVRENYAEWYGAVSDGQMDGTGTDSTAAIQRAFNDADIATRLVGQYIFSNLTLPPAKAGRGMGRHSSHLITKPGSTGTAITDQGNAAKIILEDFAVYVTPDTTYTGIIKLGYGSSPHGTEGYLNNLWVRPVNPNLPYPAVGIDVFGNVGYYYNLVSYSFSTGIRILGSANIAHTLIPYGCTEYGLYLQGVTLHGTEIEAPADGCVPIYLYGNSDLTGVNLSLANNSTLSHLVEIGASCTNWQLNALNLIFGTEPETVTITNGNIKAGGSYFGGNATGGNYGGEGNYSSSYNAYSSMSLKGQQFQAFSVSVTNAGGILQHRIGSTSTSGAVGNFYGKVGNASPTYSNTPTGSDATTAFASGAKVSTLSPYVLILDTGAQNGADSVLSSSVTYNDTEIGYRVVPSFVSYNVNGVTRTRLCFLLYNAATGATAPIDTSSIPAGKTLSWTFTGYLQ